MEAEAMQVSAFPKRPRSLKPFSDPNTLQFASVMAIVVFAMLLVFMTIPTSHHSTSTDLPTVLHALSMPGADRDDAIKIAVMRDSQVPRSRQSRSR